jgi:hypothetical protein
MHIQEVGEVWEANPSGLTAFGNEPIWSPVWNLQNNILLKTFLHAILHQFACDKKIVSGFLSVNKGQMSIWMMK